MSLWELINRPSHHPMYDLSRKKQSYLSPYLASLFFLTLFPSLEEFSYFLVYKRYYLLWIIIYQHFQNSLNFIFAPKIKSFYFIFLLNYHSNK